MQKAAAEAAVVVTKRAIYRWATASQWVFLMAFGASLQAAVLPEDRADVMYHSYDGGDITIDGPAVLVRKGVTDDISVSAQYYVDEISSASIDVMVVASPYTEERTEYTVGADYLINKTIISAGYTNSSENDYEADTYSLGVSQDFFGDLSTLSLGFAYGSDEVGMSTDPTFEEPAEHRSYQLSWSQVVTKNLIMNFIYHVITDEGFLRNPYRWVRFDNGDGTFSTESEHYPETRTSQALAVRGKYFMPYRAAFSFEYRRYDDTWKINGYNLDVGYIHPIGENWILEFDYRYYKQSAAEFYSDLFDAPGTGGRDFRARDKELSDFETNSYSATISYEFDIPWTRWLEKGSVNLAWTHIRFDYNNFRDATQTQFAAGEEPLYNMDADVVRFFISTWF